MVVGLLGEAAWQSTPKCSKTIAAQRLSSTIGCRRRWIRCPVDFLISGPARLTQNVRRIARMQAQEVYRLLVRRVRRGIVMFGTLSAVLCIASGLALADRHTAWAAAAFVAAILVGLGFRHVRSRDISARKISANPKIVYWAHPTVIPANEQWLLRNTTVQSLSLHLRDGSQFDACLSPTEMESFIAWLRESNPAIRLGTYDTTTPEHA